ncbi:MAG: hypothetical protein KME04_01530 [Pleurocapsa minor GSE-CHR-MK-17-07R]|jgi:hypothetical protein|nr:hypothetical protein [Pleurocapsa minor GSE-CHR-MK 17-07R]
MSARPFKLDHSKPFFVFDTPGDWHAVVLHHYIFDSRGEYIGFVMGEQHDVFTASGEWIGNLYPDGRIIRKRGTPRPPLLKQLPPKPPKPANFPARAPLPPQNGELGFDKLDVLDEDPEVFKRLSDLTPDAE